MSEEGLFHRHSVIHNQKDGNEYMPLVEIAEKNNTILIFMTPSF